MAVRPAASRKSLPPRKKRRGQHLESLENRQLFSVINVVNYGATPNDGNDDSGSIQKALNASKDGDTILFPGGSFDLKTEIKSWPSERTYRGEDDATLRGKSSKGQLLSFRGDDVTITGLTFEGGGIFFDRASGFNQNIFIDNNIFRLDTSGENPNGITFTSGVKHADFTNNYFTAIGGSGFAIYGYNYNDLLIANNEVVNVNAGFHIDAFAGSGNLLVEQNYITGARGMGMEFQGTASNLVFQDNWFEHPNLSADKKRNNNSMAFSLILDKSSNITIQRNTVIAPERPDGIGCRIGFEVGGDNTIVHDNYVDGINHVLAVNDGVGTCSVTAKNNVFKNMLQGAKISFPSSSPKRTFDQSNNGPDVKLSWSLSRGKPGRNHRLGDGSPVTNDDDSKPTGPVAPDPVIPVEDIPLDPTDTTPKDPQTDPTPAQDPFPTDSTPTDDTPTDSAPDDSTTAPDDTTQAPPDEVTTPVTSKPTPSTPTTPTTPTAPKPTTSPVQLPPLNAPTPVSKPVAPAAPTKVAAKAVATNRIDITWADASSNETGFLIERSLDGMNWGQIGTVGANITKFASTNLAYGMKYYFRVRAYNSGGASAFGNLTWATTPSVSPIVVSKISTPTSIKKSGPISVVTSTTTATTA